MKIGADYAAMTVRPYQLLCLVCSLGEDSPAAADGRCRELLAAIRDDPDRPIALRCNVDDEFAYQAVGTGEDTPEGAEYNRRRDLETLRRLDLAPGAILPARLALKRLLAAIPSISGICGCDTVTSEAWRGCAGAKSGAYVGGRAKGMGALIPPREQGVMERDKDRSIEDMLQAEAIRVRPHILVCAVAQYGSGLRPPFAEDNLPEMLQYLLKHPDTLITLVPGADWMMCGPCPSRVPQSNACVCGAIGSGGLYNEIKDLNVLQHLGLTYGTTMRAKELYELIFERIQKPDGICALEGEMPPLSVWRDGCGASATPCPGYAVGREALMQGFARA